MTLSSHQPQLETRKLWQIFQSLLSKAHIFTKKGFVLTAVSFATSTLETKVVAIWMVWTELASVPVVSCILLLHSAYCSWSSEDWAMIKVDLAAPRESVVEEIDCHNPQGSSQKSLGFRPTSCLPENFWISGIPKLLRYWYRNKYSYSALLYACTQSPKQQLITQRKKDTSAL